MNIYNCDIQCRVQKSTGIDHSSMPHKNSRAVDGEYGTIKNQKIGLLYLQYRQQNACRFVRLNEIEHHPKGTRYHMTYFNVTSGSSKSIGHLVKGYFDGKPIETILEMKML